MYFYVLAAFCKLLTKITKEYSRIVYIKHMVVCQAEVKWTKVNTSLLPSINDSFELFLLLLLLFWLLLNLRLTLNIHAYVIYWKFIGKIQSVTSAYDNFEISFYIYLLHITFSSLVISVTMISWCYLNLFFLILYFINWCVVNVNISTYW